MSDVIKDPILEEVENGKEVVPDIDPCEKDVVILKNACPINSSIIKNEDKKVGNITYLCVDNTNSLFIINRFYPIKDELDELSFESLPFAEFESDFVTDKIEKYWLTTKLPRYSTNFQFYTDENYLGIYTYSIKAQTNRKYKIKMTNEVFMGLLYLDKYPLSDDPDNDHDLSLAILNTSKPLNKDAKIFRVSDAKILGLADATYREEPNSFIDKLKNIFAKDELVSTNIAVKLLVTNLEKSTESVQLLAPFDVGVVFDDIKYKGQTLDTIQEGYLKDGDQYVANLTVIDAKLYGVDKTYMIIRGENKNKESILFLIDDLVKEQINTLINEF